MPDNALVYHLDAALFRDAIRFTSAETGFSERLIEKDYYCSVALADLAASETGVVFKGGTCLSKVHAEFFRLSGDLDFAMSTPVEATRSQSSKKVDPFKSHLTTIEGRLDVLRLVDPLRGYNNSTQYGGRLAYVSAITGQDDYIKVEVSVREPVVEAPAEMVVRTLLLDPFRRSPALEGFDVSVLTRREAYAEKLRAALSRREPAIRDFFDLHHAISLGSVDIADQALISLVRQKLSIPGNDPIDMSPKKLESLRPQLDTHLKSVLRSQDLLRFNLDLAFTQVADIATRL